VTGDEAGERGERGAFRAGVVRTAPLVVGVVPFGLVAGVTAVEAGLSALQAVGMSVLVYAGASQLAAIELIGRAASPLVVAATVAIVNARLVMYSASIAPSLAAAGPRLRAVCAYLLTDQAYAVSTAEFGDRRDGRGRVAFYLGAALTIWLPYQLSTAAGAVLGRVVPPAWELSFAAPLVFLALLVPAVEDRPSLAAAAVAAVAAVLGRGLALNVGLVVAAVAGVLAGVAVEARTGDDGGEPA
jgi:predicted branched-subunit amino acid permease